jgi:hypothetical protein
MDFSTLYYSRGLVSIQHSFQMLGFSRFSDYALKSVVVGSCNVRLAAGLSDTGACQSLDLCNRLCKSTYAPSTLVPTIAVAIVIRIHA